MLISVNSGLHSARPGKERIPMEEALAFFADTGFEAVDINFSAVIREGELDHEPVLDGENWRERIQGLKTLAQELGLVISHSHAPFQFRYGDKEDPDYGFCREMMLRSIEATSILGAEYIVVHPVVSGDKKKTLVRESIEALAEYVEYGREFGIKLAVENMSCTGVEELLEIAGGVSGAVCLDSGHANIYGMDLYQAVLELKDRLKVLHLHDNFGKLGEGVHCDKHLPPFFGTIDWEMFVKGLREAGYQGTFNYEVNVSRIPEEAREGMARCLVSTARALLGTGSII
ncbi:TIM barrel protein [Clostridium sp. MCC353]|uniref:sugar phosphate isomerase/epimerase family protein n=1 Tax=Clostridium sp. MCC353 TaxID=2592646 RepID=UPI001C0197FD|nr:sugar phosphate isomerase/epimerase family protein [Clostridium sp. MCC353]MBT9775715.1 TIM barrel protein [Clostridium sp. MCC353]